MNKGTAIDIPSIMFAEGVKAERDRVVAYIRADAALILAIDDAPRSTVGATLLQLVADAIERGEHLK